MSISLTSLKDSYFFTQLVSLDLGQNFIEFIAETAFVTLKNLEVLHLDANKLAKVPNSATFGPISASLLSLNLGQNAIQSLEDNVFLPLKNLRYVGCFNTAVYR